MSFGKTSSTSQTKDKGSQTSTPNNLPYLQQGWDAASGLLTNTAGQGQDLVNQGMGLVSSGANAASGAAIGGLNTATNLANGGSANAANKYLTPFANGSMNGANPYFNDLLKQISYGVQGATDGSYGASGRYGSGANANAFNSSMANVASQLGYQNYGDSLNRQLQASGQLSNNYSNSTNQALQALGIMPSLGAAATNAGDSAMNAGYSPYTTNANMMAAYGPGGGTGTYQGTSNTSGSTFGFGASVPVNPITLFG